MLKGLFDEYSLKARVNPALLVLLPVFIVVAVWYPDLYEFGKAIVGLLVGCGAVAILAHFSRECGKQIENKLWEKWGGAPATMALHNNDKLIEPPRKKRFHDFLESRIASWNAPTREDEINDPKKSYVIYESAVKWLIERTRNKERFPLVFAENVNYGFRRNVLGLKPWGILFSIVCLVVNSWLVYKSPLPFGIASTLLNTFMALWWIVVVSEDWVYKVASEYARKLLASCDLLSE